MTNLHDIRKRLGVQDKTVDIYMHLRLTESEAVGLVKATERLKMPLASWVRCAVIEKLERGE